MLDQIVTVLHQPSLIWLVLTVIIAGMVRGFTGFGTALVFVPVASRFLHPTEIVVTLIVLDMIGPMVHVPNALRVANKSEVFRLGLGTLIGLPLGVFLLTKISPVIFGWIVSCIILLVLLALVNGWRYSGAVGAKTPFFVGGLSGFMGGFSGLTGPPVILFYLGRQSNAAVARASLILFFTINELFSLVVFGVNGLLLLKPIVFGLILIAPYTIANLVGARLFKWKGEEFFRPIAYTIIGIAALIGLPIFG